MTRNMIKAGLLILLMLPVWVIGQVESAYFVKDTLKLATIWENLPAIAARIDSAAYFGLEKGRYSADYLRGLCSRKILLPGKSDSAVAEVRIMSAITMFTSDVLLGREPAFSYDGLNAPNNCINLRDSIDNFLSWRPHHAARAEYQNLQRYALDTTSVSHKMAAVRTLETLRWMECILEQNEFTIAVNIPSATLLLYRYDSIIFECKVIVGKRSTRTPVFASRLTDITIYPYWRVPKSIAVKELLPEIRKDITYLERNNFQVIDQAGHIVDADSVKWKDLSASYFPYVIRQSTGCDNSLGLIKLNINDPFNVYLHDTPWKALFEARNRFFSHGCVRVEKAKELSHILLKENSIAVDTLDENNPARSDNPKIIPLQQKAPVLILYQTAWFNKLGAVQFYPDIYSRLKGK